MCLIFELFYQCARREFSTWMGAAAIFLIEYILK
jgi:hypothetical protein